ncbi:hypothetical protein ACGFS9_17980 [Streptomyces sp. NPDC048566]|uniref:hypothetical protein n=1 Tax=Streptomyces sp. NPDC048566 TaxID=3365569 RepID=UPI0037147DC9
MNKDPGAPVDDDDYSATVLASHWIQRPGPGEQTAGTRALDHPTADTVALGGRPRTPPDRTVPDTPPDRVEGTLLRFGPGVSADTVRRATASAVPLPPPAPRRTWRRHALPVVALLAVLVFLLCHRAEPSVGVEGVAVAAVPRSPGCDETADVVATVVTDGRAGELAYRWVRSDGTASKVLREKTTRGQKRARLHLLWTFQGEGRYAARAELRLLSPVRRTAAARLAYHCP